MRYTSIQLRTNHICLTTGTSDTHNIVVILHLFQNISSAWRTLKIILTDMNRFIIGNHHSNIARHLDLVNVLPNLTPPPKKKSCNMKASYYIKVVYFWDNYKLGSKLSSHAHLYFNLGKITFG